MDNDEQEKYYSGKRSNHTFKSQMIILPDGKDIVDVVAGEPGPKSDITLFWENRERFAPKQKFKGNLAYIGEDLIETPIKKPRNRELTIEQKSENKKFSSKRIFVEHRIRSVKIFRVVQERFRLNSKKYEQVILTICGESALQGGFPPQTTANPKGQTWVNFREQCKDLVLNLMKLSRHKCSFSQCGLRAMELIIPAS